ncbi:UNVERIFIED_CONTAM: hypothetical protein FKN15_076273 [Acipenser sinensis]
MQFYFFDLRNPSEVLLGETPFVEEKGPYTYREFRPKENVRFSDNDTKVSATMPKTYVFVPEMSVGRREDDPIRTVNVPAVTVIEKFKTHPVISNLISSYMKSQNIGLFVTRTVHELLWGYKDPLLAVVHKVRPDIDEYFGLFYKSCILESDMKTGATGFPRSLYATFEKEVHVKGIPAYRFVPPKEVFANITVNPANAGFCVPAGNCLGSGLLNVSVCKQASNPYLIIQLVPSKILILLAELEVALRTPQHQRLHHRSLYATFEKEVHVKGIPAYRFVPPKEVFANITVNPANAGFCVPAGNCLGSGLLNVSVCKQGAPIIMSSPHFYQADQKYIDDVAGMNPNKEDHQTIMDINPVSRCANYYVITAFLPGRSEIH